LAISSAAGGSCSALEVGKKTSANTVKAKKRIILERLEFAIKVLLQLNGLSEPSAKVAT
jgi:hypothetical protein